MIIVKLAGGLGNQLFQYALGRAIEIECGAEVSFDSSSFIKDANRHYMLDPFATKVKLSTRPNRFSRIFRKEKNITENNMAYLPSLYSTLKRGGSFYLDGYWQTEKYFQSIRPQLLSEITLRNPYSQDAQIISQAIASSMASVSIHVRRGDYVKNPETHTIHGVCSLDYYRAAIKTIQEKIHNPHFFIFSDDIEWVKDNIDLDPTMTTYVSGSGLNDEEELMLMSECKHNIIANSSFSWWGAWLNKHPDKIIIAPKAWFADMSKDTRDIIPSTWITL